jgi:hypothetical protein
MSLLLGGRIEQAGDRCKKVLRSAAIGSGGVIESRNGKNRDALALGGENTNGRMSPSDGMPPINGLCHRHVLMPI